MIAFGDRTGEFASIAQTLRNTGLKPATKRKENHFTARMNINRLSSEIGKDTHATAQKLAVLTKLAQSKSLFDDPADKIEELTGIIKLDIQAIRKKLQNMESMVVAQGRQNEQTSTHSGVVIDTLANNLGATAMQFTKILELRTENLKSQQDRKEKFIGGSSMSSSPVLYQPFNPSLDDENPQEDMIEEVSITLPMVQTREQFLETRSQSIRAVEKTVEELRGIMTQIAFIARQQDELIVRIDEDIANTELHVNNAYSELVKYLPKVAGNRWLYLKIFAVLVVFMILFIVFFV
jgi:syntaxin 5